MSSVCSNCGRPGHFFRECREPITSLGILAYRRPGDTAEPEWLMIRRRVSIGYIEIMRGKYELRDVEGIQALVDQATLTERMNLLTMGFAELWRDLWNGPASRRYHQEYEQAKAKFDVLRARGVLATCCTASTTSWTEPEWGFPKGRRSSSETELTCALRETYEEAGVRRQDLRVLEGEPLLEEYRGSNGICYRHRYWLAEAPATLEVRMDPDNIDQRREISDVRWCKYDEAMSLIRPYNVEKRAVLEAGASRVRARVAEIAGLQQRNEQRVSSSTGFTWGSQDRLQAAVSRDDNTITHL
jgi:8-oxo-dGTP pyrophosphatase MutT (NUDIX family)